MSNKFTGGIFKIENNILYLVCRNSRMHSNRSLGTLLDFHVAEQITLNQLSSNFCVYHSQEGVICTDCSRYDYDLNHAILIDKARKTGLLRLSDIGASQKEIALYLRYWGYLEINDSSLQTELNLYKKYTKFDTSDFVFITKIDPRDGFYDQRDKLERRQCFINKKMSSNEEVDSIDYIIYSNARERFTENSKIEHFNSIDLAYKKVVQ